jgi:hypothetical protein
MSALDPSGTASVKAADPADAAALQGRVCRSVRPAGRTKKKSSRKPAAQVVGVLPRYCRSCSTVCGFWFAWASIAVED